MVIVMGYYSSALGVRAATAASAASSPDSSSRSSLLDGAHGVHGFRASPKMVTTNRNFEPLRNTCRPWRRELSVRRVKRAMDFRVLASSSDETSGEKNGQVNTENVPGWAKPNSEEPPPWARNERPPSQEPKQDIPFPVYLISSTLVAIAAVGSVFEYFNQNPIFGVLAPDSPFYTPILGFFAISGLPTAGFLFYKSIQLANKAAEEADKQDGYRR